MILDRATCKRRLAGLTGSALMLLFASSAALAQLAPVMGTHHASSGMLGASPSGGYSASVPLDLPEARGGLPVPVQVVYGGSQVGAVGMSWDVPMSFIFRSKSLAHWRPKPSGSFTTTNPPLPNAPERLSLTLAGAHIDLVRNAANTAWVARNGSEQMEVRDLGNGAMVLYDGDGLTYNFNAAGGTTGSRLDNGNLYLLRNITGPGGTLVQLGYTFTAPALPGGGTGLQINLANVRYNKHPTASQLCFKNHVLLNYDAPATAPLAMSILGSTVLTRVQKLSSISVDSKADCSASATSLRRYDFVYVTDPDTQRPQLQQVTMVGRQSTPERSVVLPVASYGYGKVTGSDGKIAYQKTQSIAMSGKVVSVLNGIGYSSAFPSDAGGLYSELLTVQGFVDFNGDGRPDFRSERGIFLNLPDASGATTLSSTGGAVNELLTENSRFHNEARFRSPIAVAVGVAQLAPMENVVDTRTQYIDVNGDGRMDFIDASAVPDRWIVKLSTPDPTDPRKTVFATRSVSTAPMRLALGLGSTAKVPLARTTTMETHGHAACWIGPPNGIWTGALFDQCPAFLPTFQPVTSPQVTFVQWELKDINGDGYPDFIYDNLPIPSPPLPPLPSGVATQGELRFTVGAPADLSAARQAKALINSLGVHLVAEDDAMFESPISAVAGAADNCGVGRWQSVPGSASGAVLYQTCGFEDVNGDGVADRITSTLQNNAYVSQAALGTGDPAQLFSTGATIQLPGALARVDTDLINPDTQGFHPRSCDTSNHYNAIRSQFLRDISGDGIPDYVESLSGAWSVRLGTGTGFAPAKLLTLPAGLELAVERNLCGSIAGDATAQTPSGMYDLDGDGQPEVLSMNVGTQSLDVYELKPPLSQIEVRAPLAGNPAAGRLVKIDNGYGAVTRIGYRSAKQHANTFHLVPFPEIVVAAEATTDTSGGVLLASTLQHAYGNAFQIFDSVQDRFVFPGYERTLTLANTVDGVAGQGVATITDYYQLKMTPFEAGMSADARFERYRKVGLVNNVTTLSGDVGSDAMALLNTLVTTDSRRTSGAHYDWNARRLPAGPAPAGNEQCVDVMYPYDFDLSLDHQLGSNDECTNHGFSFQSGSFAWRGTPGSSDPVTSDRTVQTSATVESVDDFGRVTHSIDDGDLVRGDDDLCIQTVYAAPVGSSQRLLNAPASHTVRASCSGSSPILSQESWEYDDLAPTTDDPVVRVSNGFVTAHSVSRLDAQTGAPIVDANGNNSILMFDATYDGNGNPTAVKRTRDDGATQTTTMAYDAFALVSTSMTSTAVSANGTELPALTTSITFDAVTLDTLSTIDPNGAVSSYTHDGFGRVLLSKVTPVGGSEGVLSSIGYNGFAVGQSGGRKVVQKVFTNPVAAVDVGTAAGRIGTVSIDQLGRETQTEVDLGADYAGAKLIVGRRLYDRQGRVRFLADPFPSTENANTAYGTTSHFHPDGTLSCSIRGNGPQAHTSVTSEADERYPTCYIYPFFSNRQYASMRDAASFLSGGPQDGVAGESQYSATGQLLKHTTFTLDESFNAVRAEEMHYGYDALGNLAQTTRYPNPAEGHSNGLVTRLRYDSLGQVIRLEEPGAAVQERSYDTWGAPTKTAWCDPTISSCADVSTRNRSTLMTYDALGRLTHSEDRTNNAVDADTVNDYLYDQGVDNTTPPVTATNVLGRMSKATSPTSTVSFSYDGLGRIDTQLFTDITVSPVKRYVEKRDFHGDGSLKTLHLLLPDNAFKDEKIDYGYDSAGRLRSVKYNDGTNRDLFTTTGSTDLDVFGRIRSAKYGLADFTAAYAATGRRLLQSVKVASPSPMTTSREIRFPVQAGTDASITPFDPQGRERIRREFKDGVASPTSILRDYDALGRLAGSRLFNVSTGAMIADRAFTYDPLGNLLAQADESSASHPGSVQMSYQTTDRDRICSIGYGTNAAPGTCNVQYDGVGNIVSMPTRSNGTRTFTYHANGRTKTIVNGATNATYKYDAFGAVQQLMLNSTTSNDKRRDKHFGGRILLRDEGGAPIVNRKIPGPGMTATRHGPSGGWTFAFGEPRGTRFVTDHTGAFVQDVDYQPYGEVKSPSGALPGTTNYTRQQWNGGDLLAALGVSQLGARIYDPVIGRFLSRDPLIIPRTAATTNPYAFAMNDPVNLSDPTGLDTERPSTEPVKPCDPGVCGSNGRGHSLGDIGHKIKCVFVSCHKSTPTPTPPPRTSTTSKGCGRADACHKPYVPSRQYHPELRSLHRPAWKYGWIEGSPFSGIPDPLDPVVESLTDFLTDYVAKTFNGIFDIYGASHPSLATAKHDLRPGVRTLVSVGVNAEAIFLTGLVGEAFAAERSITAAARYALGKGGTVEEAVAAGLITPEGKFTARFGFESMERAAAEGKTAVFGKWPANVEYVARTPGTVTIDVLKSAHSPMYNAGSVRGALESGMPIIFTSSDYTGVFGIEAAQIRLHLGLP